MNNRKNFISALIYQAVAMIQGLILPRLIIATFGSDVNGLVSSITQFLSFISLLEGGLGAVVLAELYRPIEDEDLEKIKSILYSCKRLFRQLAYIYVAFTIIIAIGYPLFISKRFSFSFVSSLTLILSISTLGQYLFAISNKLLLQATQKIYIVNYICSGTLVLNILISVTLIYMYPQIHVIKLFSGLIFLLQPVLFNCFIDKRYICKGTSFDKKYVLKNRWSGFAQNLAYFINMNTDIALVTIFLGITNVSVYTIYMLAINALRQIISNAAISYQSALGKYYAIGNKDDLLKKFEKFELVTLGISLVLYCTCLQLINPFVSLYTKGVTDADYYQPVFALIMILANMLYCIREPYRIMIFAAGKFKETNFGSMVEAGLNIVISLILVSIYGLVGIAIGTLIAILYRYIYFIVYLNKSILKRSTIRRYIKLFFEIIIVYSINMVYYYKFKINIAIFLNFGIDGVITVAAEVVIVLLVYLLGEIISKLFRIKNIM
ncbi:MAG: hypothetical protein IJ819_04625 [Clostridiales bacterium]|nr:hypothetical protein [Clostridiales bacterium]